MRVFSRTIAGTIAAYLFIFTGFLWGQGNNDEYQVWELAPMVVVYPDEQLKILSTASLPAYRSTTSDDGSVTVHKLLWHAIGGHIEGADDRTIVYRAPAQEGVYLVYWSDGTQKFGFFVKVREDGWGKYAMQETTFEGLRGVFLPLTRANSAPVGLFLVNQRKARKPADQRVGFINDEGAYRFDPPNTPFFPDRPPRCNNGRCEEVRESRTQSLGFQKELGEITITYSLSLKLSEIGIEHTQGATIKVIANTTRTLHFDLIDCYRCENGQCKYVGSRIEYLVCDKVNNYFSPQWMCEAIRRSQERHRDHPLFPDFPPCDEPMATDRGCKYSGDCPCPPGDRPSFGRSCR